MSVVQNFLAFMETKGVSNVTAVANAKLKHAVLFPDRPSLSISAASVSRMRKGEGLAVSRDPGFLRAMVAASEIESNLPPIEALQGLGDQVAVKAVLAKYRDKAHAVSRFDREAISLLVGVWQQINFSTYNVNGKEGLEIRIAQRLIYKDGNKLKTQSVGITTDWRGELLKMGSYIKISEGIANMDFSERGEYIYEYPSLQQKEISQGTGFIVGAALVIVKPKDVKKTHLFAGKTIMRKRIRLSRRYGNDPNGFFEDRADIRHVYCWRGSIENMRKSSWAQDVEPLLEFLKNDERSYMNDYAYVCV